jgi:type II secretory ATPase GspE/PulE/Tfp pilus assembly ATPase PilB-like protein
MLKTTMQSPEHQILEWLTEEGVVSSSAAEDLLRPDDRKRLDLETDLIERLSIPKAAVLAMLSRYYGHPAMAYEDREVLDRGLLKTLNPDYLRLNHWVPIKKTERCLDVLMADPMNLEIEHDIRRAFPGVTIRVFVGLKRDVERYLDAATGQQSNESITDILGVLVSEAQIEQHEQAETSRIGVNDSAIVRLVDQIIMEANRLGASDIHIEPFAHDKDTVVRFRVDGTCFTSMKVPAAYRRAIVSRIKIMANLDIAERRKPQDGKIRFKLNREKEMELRVATLPTANNNEDVVMRLLTAQGPIPLEAMGFSSDSTLETLKGLAEKPYGIILCVGPTGSGKTTTLHALLRHINTEERKIWTVEDPVEITQDGLRQVQVHPKIGLTFASALRAFLRADPDVIMVGEMRDRETADIALEASLTGHLVLSTLHTNNAVETVTRLLDLGCDPFNFADAMLGVLAQRLCKRLCENCKEPYLPTRREFDELAELYGNDAWPSLGVRYHGDLRLFRPRGCDECNHSGFRGRLAIHELLVGSEDIQRLIQTRAKSRDLLAVARSQGMTTLVQDGIRKVLKGDTTVRQVRSVALR